MIADWQYLASLVFETLALNMYASLESQSEVTAPILYTGFRSVI